MKKVLIISLVVYLFLLPLTAHASTLTKVNISQTVQADEVFFAFFDVSDETGAPITGLGSEDVSLSIGAHEPEVTVRTVEESGLGIGYVFAVDISKSLTEKEFEGVRAAIDSWIGGMKDGDYAAMSVYIFLVSCSKDLYQL